MATINAQCKGTGASYQSGLASLPRLGEGLLPSSLITAEPDGTLLTRSDGVKCTPPSTLHKIETSHKMFLGGE